jgi:hypothetical protein
MAVVKFEVQSREPYEGGVPFGDAGAYERIEGVLHFAVDPLHAANVGIVDLDRAPRDERGLVHFSADLSLLQPIDGSKANGRLLADVVNRGGRTFVSYNLAPRDPKGIPPGDGFLMRRGWTIAAIGWQWDVVRPAGLLGLQAPTALIDGQPMVGWVSVTHELSAPAPDVILSDRAHQPYVAVDVDQPDARMFVRDYPDAPRQEIERSRWRFARIEDGRAVPDPTRAALDGGFEAGRFYEIIYRTNTSPVVGTGILAFRDAATFLRTSNAADNPARRRLSHAFAFGSSQSGRFLRTLIAGGFNTDEDGHTAYDGFHVHIAGGRMGEFNYRFGQPSLTSPYGPGYRPPFTYEDTVDPLREETLPGLLRAVRAQGAVPCIIATNSATEYWRGDASMLHVDPSGTRDLPEPPETRAYFLTGAQHGGATLPLTDASPLEPAARGAHYFNTTDYRPLLRAALVNLERWVCEGVEPPPSTLPRVADGTAVPRDRVVEVFRTFPTAVAPIPDRLASLPRLDFGPDGDRAATVLPPVTDVPYPTLVSAVDADGNEVAGMRLPDVTVPLATLMGWNPRHEQTGGSGQIMPLTGSTVPFAVTAGERAATGDPRPSVEERYRDRDDYLARVRAEAEQLTTQRYLLDEDVEVVVEQAAARWDALVPAAVR